MTLYTRRWMGFCYFYGLSAHTLSGDVTWLSCLTDQRRRRVTRETQGDRADMMGWWWEEVLVSAYLSNWGTITSNSFQVSFQSFQWICYWYHYLPFCDKDLFLHFKSNFSLKFRPRPFEVVQLHILSDAILCLLKERAISCRKLFSLIAIFWPLDN